MVIEKLIFLVKKHKINVQENINIRPYPDIVLNGGILGKKLVALDVKTGRRSIGNNGRIDGFTLGSYAGYFRKPTSKLCCGELYSYKDFNEH